MADSGAWNAGWNLGAGYAQEKFAHKQALADEAHEAKIKDLIDQRSAIVAKLPNLLDETGKPTQAYNDAFDSLKKVNSGLIEAYDPTKHEGAIQKLGHLLTDHLGIKVNGETLPERRQDKSDALAAKKDDLATTQTNQQVAAAPLSPAQEDNAAAASQLRKMQGTIKNIKTLFPNQPPEVVNRWQNELAQQMMGVKPIAEKYFTQLATTKDEQGNEHYWRVPMDPVDQPEEVNFDGQKMVPKATAQGKPKGLKFDPVTGEVVDQDTAKRYNASDPNNPPDVAAMFKGADKVTAQKEAFQTRLAQLRGAAYGTARQMAPLQVLDTANGNAPGYATYLDMKKQPGRYIPATSGAKALSQENLIEDLTGVSGNLRKDINSMQADFPEDMKLKIAIAARSEDPSGALDQLISSGALGALSDDQFQVYVDLQQLAENAMAMRSVLGAGQGSDDVRKAITRTLPSLLSPNKRDALVQLDAYDNTIARLRRGVPKVPLRTDILQGAQGGQAPAGGSSEKGSRSLAAAMALPINKGKTEAEVEKHLKDLGYTVTRP